VVVFSTKKRKRCNLAQLAGIHFVGKRVYGIEMTLKIVRMLRHYRCSKQLLRHSLLEEKTKQSFKKQLSVLLILKKKKAAFGIHCGQQEI
jgi:hypothetical protein